MLTKEEWDAKLKSAVDTRNHDEQIVYGVSIFKFTGLFLVLSIASLVLLANITDTSSGLKAEDGKLEYQQSLATRWGPWSVGGSAVLTGMVAAIVYSLA